MGLVIYKKADNSIVAEYIQYPLHDNEIFQKFLALGKYSESDYGAIEMPRELVQEAAYRVLTVKDGKLSLAGKRTTTTEPLTPDENTVLKNLVPAVENLADENATLMLQNAKQQTEIVTLNDDAAFLMLQNATQQTTITNLEAENTAMQDANAELMLRVATIEMGGINHV